MEARSKGLPITDTDQNTGNQNTGIHYNTGKKGYDGAFYLLNTGNGNTGIVWGDVLGVKSADKEEAMKDELESKSHFLAESMSKM